MKKVTVILLLFLGLRVFCYSQSQKINKSNYIQRFELSKKLLKKKKYHEAENILKNLLNKPDINIVGCNIHSEISNQLGVSLYFQRKYFKAYKIWKENTMPLRNRCENIDPERRAQTLYNIGYTLGKLYDYKNSIIYLDSCLNYLNHRGLLYKKKYAEFYFEQYYNYALTGDYNLAEANAFKALSILDSLKMKKSLLSAKIYGKIGKNFTEKKEFNLAKKYLFISKRIFSDLNSYQIVYAYRGLAYLYLVKSEYENATKWIKKAFKYEQDLTNNDLAELSYIYQMYGLILSYSGYPKQALLKYFKSLKIQKTIHTSNSSISLIYENIAGAYGRIPMLDSALFYIDLSIEKLHSLAGIDVSERYIELKQNDFPKLDMIRKLQMKGKFLTRKYLEDKNIGYLYDAENNFSLLDSLVFLLRKEIQNKDSKIILGNDLDTIYNYAIHNAYLLWQTTGNEKYKEIAYHYSSENKAVVFTETKEELNGVWDIIDHDLRSQFLELNNNLSSNLKQKQYAALRNDTLIYQELNTEFLKLSKKKEKLLNQIKVEYPQFYKQIYGKLKPLSIRALQDNLDEDNAILEYYIKDKSLYIFSITKNNFFSCKNDYKINIDSILNDFANELSYYKNRKKISDISKNIYPLLFPKKLNAFLEKNNISRLILIRDKSMNKMPFAALMKPPYSKNDYLIYKYALSYVFNNKYIWSYNPEKIKKEFDFGGFATNYNQKTLNDIKKDTIFWEDNSPPWLEPLNQSEKEIKIANKLLIGKIWTGNNATLTNFLKNSSKFKILHLSLHSLLISGNSKQNAIIFQKVDPDSNYILKAIDIIGLRLNNYLSVLSACFTSDGKIISGEGIMSIARNFSLSGSPAIIASQWEAYEGQTAYILKQFYNNIKKGYTKDIAMQKAQINFLKSVPDRYNFPADWANLMIIGDVEPIPVINSSSKNSNIILIVILIIFFIIIISFFFFFRAKLAH